MKEKDSWEDAKHVHCTINPCVLELPSMKVFEPQRGVIGRGEKESRYGFTDSYEANFSQKAYRLKETKEKTGLKKFFWRKDIQYTFFGGFQRLAEPIESQALHCG